LAADLDRWLTGEPLSVRPPTVTKLARYWLRQHFGAAGWIVVIGLAFGLIGGVMTWLRGGALLCASTIEAYKSLPNVDPPWLIAWLRSTPQWLQIILFLANVIVVCAAGLIISALVRPKNRAADVAAGIVTGVVYGVTFLVLCGATIGTILAAVEPAGDELLALSRAAWEEPTRQPDLRSPDQKIRPRGVEQILEKYPDLRNVPASKRGKIYYEKLRADLIADIPLGIWLAGLFVLPFVVLVFTLQVMVAGPLLRKHGRRYTVLLPYFERALPVMFLISNVASFTFAPLLLHRYLKQLNVDLPRVGLMYLPMFALLALAILGVQRQWPRTLRLALHVGWFLAYVIATAYWSR